MSFDDFIITNFNSGAVDTFPKFIYVAATRGIPAQANVIGSAMFIVSLLVVVGVCSAIGYLTFRYTSTSRSADYSKTERVEIQKSMAELVLDETDDWDDETVICVVDSAYRGLFQNETDYTVAVYVLDEEAFAAGQAEDESYTLEKLWAYSKSGPKKDKYQSLIKVAEAKIHYNEKTDEVLSIGVTPVE